MHEDNFKKLAERYVTGTISGPDKEEFFRLLEQDEYQRQLETILQQEWEEGIYDEPGNEKLGALIETSVMQQIRNGAPVRGLSFFRRYRVAAAAVLVFILAGFGWFYLRQAGGRHEKAVVTTPAPDILPGKNGAILTLADGGTIVLDTAQNGLLTTQGNTNLIKLSSGQIAYETGEVNGEILYNTLSTPNGRQFNVTLPDGSGVWLNAASSIRYPTRFAGDQRRVEISGEVYFEVAQDKNKAFIVAVNGMEVEVLGTHFNVMAYTDEEAIKTSLLEGRVRLRKIAAEGDGNTNEILLVPGQQGAYSAAGQFSLVRNADMEEALAWKNGLFKFNDADLRFVLRQAARWYDIEVVEKGPVSDERYRGTIAREVKLSEFLKILELNKVRFTLEERKLIINP